MPQPRPCTLSAQGKSVSADCSHGYAAAVLLPYRTLRCSRA